MRTRITVDIEWDKRQLDSLMKVLNVQDPHRLLETFARRALVLSSVGTAIESLDAECTSES